MLQDYQKSEEESGKKEMIQHGRRNNEINKRK